MHSCNDDTTNQGSSAWLTEEDAGLRHPHSERGEKYVDEHVDKPR
jgi:hypothetical protein